MKKITLIVLLINLTIINAQETLVIDYNVYYNTDRPTQKKATLYVNSQEQLYIQGKNSINEVAKADENNQIKITSKGYIDFYNLNKENNNLYAKLDIKGKEYLLEEHIPKMNWQLLNETKTISNILCQKATLSFRGRNYTCWFTNAYGVSGGPWKFNNIPGLIINITDDTGRYIWEATSIENTDKKITSISKPECNSCTTISIKQYAKLRYGNTSNSLVRSRNSIRGSTSRYIAGPRNGFETLFEWEEN